MASLVAPVQKFAKKFEAGGKGLLGTAAGGAGTHLIMTTADNLTGGNVQKLLSVNLPILGPTGLIDFLTYIVYANGLKISKRGIVALAAAKLTSGTLSAIGPINIPGFSNNNLAQQSSTSAGQAGGPI